MNTTDRFLDQQRLIGDPWADALIQIIFKISQ